MIHALLLAAATLVGLFLGTQSAAAADGPSAPAHTPKVSTDSEPSEAIVPQVKTVVSDLTTDQQQPTRVDGLARQPLAKVAKAVESKRFVASNKDESRSLPTESTTREGDKPVAKALDETATTGLTLNRTSTEVDRAAKDTTNVLVGTVDTTAKPVETVVRDTGAIVGSGLKVVDGTVGAVVDPAVEDVVEPAVDAVEDVVGVPLDLPSLPTIPPLAPAIPDTSGTESPVDLPIDEPVLAPAQPATHTVGPVAVPALLGSPQRIEPASNATESLTGSDELRVTTQRTVGASHGGSSDRSPLESLRPGVAPASSGGSAAAGGSYAPVGVVAGESIHYLPPTLAETDFQKSIATAEGVRPGQRPD